MDIAMLKKNQLSVKAQIRRDIVSILSEAVCVTKKSLFDALFEKSPLSPAERTETDADSAAVLYRSLIGAVLNDSVETGEVSIANNSYSLNRDVPIYIRSYEVKEYVRNILKENVPYSKKEIFLKKN